MVYGNMPEGWVDTEEIQIWKQWGTTPPCWAMQCLLPTKEALIKTGKLVAPPVGKEQREQVMQSIIANDAEVERMLRDEKQPYLGRPL